ncbi:hypothetical protein JJB27_03710 [Campylobacter fetus subsp. venerealis]|uniref:hypothetical protein n=1 Tax=Campylobacter fetus TaxID=196 RepID=UPI00081881D9|nr:hypothetical protein [Campylobacter fetus]MBK3498183.1 hypothetical protein [Campylobacter fetus subsp. venerealis]MBK3502185.1 hypothetical protein [Campylobacter fetus subsp. venerealis]OCS16819.1 hypothetical protein CfvWBT01109_01925 [Campylobacter fetus subsp. venerealis]
MKKFRILGALALMGVILTGCGEEAKKSNGGLVKLENSNPAIKQENYDAMIGKLKETIKNQDFEFYHVQTLFNDDNWKNYTSEAAFGKFTNLKARNELINDRNLVVVAIDKNNKAIGSVYEIHCTDKVPHWGKYECDPEFIRVGANGKK